MSWIELHSNLPEHRKTIRLKNALRLRGSQTVGHLCLLWLWALDHAQEGRLEQLTPRDLARIADFPERRAAEFVDALLDAGFLDRNDSGLCIHDWEDYAGRLNEIRQKNRERKQKSRARLRDVTVTAAPKNVTVTGLPDQTGPDQTGPDQTQPKLSKISAGGGGARGADADVSAYLDKRLLSPDALLDSPEELNALAGALTDSLFRTFADRTPTAVDRCKVLQWISGAEQGPEGLRACLDAEARDRLCYAFEQAALAGKGGCWPYIEGVLGRLEERDLRTLGDLKLYEIAHRAGDKDFDVREFAR